MYLFIFVCVFLTHFADFLWIFFHIHRSLSMVPWYTWPVRKVSNVIFSRGNYWSTGGRGYLHAHTWIFPRQQTASVACSQCVSESVHAVRIALLFCAKMMEQLEQQYCIKFCQKLGDSQVETIWKIQWAFGDDAMGITQIKDWYNRFNDGRTSVENDAYAGRCSTSRNDELTDQVQTFVMQDRRVTVRELAEEVGINTGSVHSILTDVLAMWRVFAKFMPKLLTMEQKQLRWKSRRTCWTTQTVTPNSWTSWPLVMIHGFTGTTRKPRRSHHSGNIQHPRDQKRPGKCGAMSKWCWPFSLVPVGWCITSTHHMAKTLTKNTTWKSFVTFAMLCGARDQTCGQREHGCCIMTMHQLIPRNWFKFSWPNTTFCGLTGSQPSQHGSLWFLAVPPPENAAERDLIWVTIWHYLEHNSQAVLHSQRGIPEMLLTMAEPLGEVCSVTRRLLRRGLGLQTSRRVNVFFPAKDQILFEQATYDRSSTVFRRKCDFSGIAFVLLL